MDQATAQHTIEKERDKRIHKTKRQISLSQRQVRSPHLLSNAYARRKLRLDIALDNGRVSPKQYRMIRDKLTSYFESLGDNLPDDVDEEIDFDREYSFLKQRRSSSSNGSRTKRPKVKGIPVDTFFDDED